MVIFEDLEKAYDTIQLKQIRRPESEENLVKQLIKIQINNQTFQKINIIQG